MPKKPWQEKDHRCKSDEWCPCGHWGGNDGGTLRKNHDGRTLPAPPVEDETYWETNDRGLWDE